MTRSISTIILVRAHKETKQQFVGKQIVITDESDEYAETEAQLEMKNKVSKTILKGTLGALPG
jgi:hypothetical protein